MSSGVRWHVDASRRAVARRRLAAFATLAARMIAVSATKLNPQDPLEGLTVAQAPPPQAREGWVIVDVKAAALNHHDLWSLRGVGLSEDKLPMILGCDAAGTDEDGNEVIVHAVISDPHWTGDETLDERRTLLSEKHQGTFAQQVTVPKRNLLPKPQALSFQQAACLPTAWLTAYRMLFTRAQAQPGETVLVQGATGGVATAAIMLGAAAGLRMWASSRSQRGRELALQLGADGAFEPNQRLPQRVDAVMETVGEATWAHSVKSLRPGGRIVIAGATSGAMPPAQLSHVFFRQLSVLGSTMGTKLELERLIEFMLVKDVRPPIAASFPFDEAKAAFARLLAGGVAGKIVLTPAGS